MKKQVHRVICDLCEAKVLFNMVGCPKCGHTGWEESIEKGIELHADEIYGWLQDAVGDMAGHDDESVMANLSMSRKWQNKVKKAKREGVRDIPGWLADEYYNDIDTLCDLSGDRIHDAASTMMHGMGVFKEPKSPLHELIRLRLQIAVAKDMKKRSHNSLVKALNKHIFRWESYLKDGWRKQVEAEAAAYGDSQIPPWFKEITTNG
jgi:hypothetical protein